MAACLEEAACPEVNLTERQPICKATCLDRQLAVGNLSAAGLGSSLLGRQPVWKEAYL
jgi:hypothetical protein